MNRRALLKAIPAGMLCSCRAFAFNPDEDSVAASPRASNPPRQSAPEQLVVETPPDVTLEGPRLELLHQTVRRLRAVQGVVGHGNFGLLGLDDALNYARRYPQAGRFTRAELSFLEEIFFQDASRYGFFGAKVSNDITARVPKREAVKIPGTGHYLYKGNSLALYRRVREDVGESCVLTSGIRGIVKQMYLFLAKGVRTGGNLSVASRSLAPPGHSYHGIGDFDVGKRGFGLQNFSEDFATTDEYRRLIDLGYVLIRYPSDNPFGVRFEPWHIKAV